jgi:heat shock protein HslJ
MKKIKKIMASVLMIAALAAVTVSCSKDDDEDSLIGRWTYREGNMRFSVDGTWYDAKEEGLDVSSFNNSFSGLFFVFEKNGTLSGGMGGQSGAFGSYSVSGDKITIREGSSSYIMGYRISGKTLDLIWYRSTFHALGVSTAEIDDMGFDDFEMIMTFSKN